MKMTRDFWLHQIGRGSETSRKSRYRSRNEEVWLHSIATHENELQSSSRRIWVMILAFLMTKRREAPRTISRSVLFRKRNLLPPQCRGGKLQAAIENKKYPPQRGLTRETDLLAPLHGCVAGHGRVHMTGGAPSKR